MSGGVKLPPTLVLMSCGVPTSDEWWCKLPPTLVLMICKPLPIVYLTTVLVRVIGAYLCVSTT